MEDDYDDHILLECKRKLARFRVKELKDVLNHFYLSNTGRNQELMDRILALLSSEQALDLKKKLIQKEDVAKLINDIYRKMTITGAKNPVTGRGTAWIRKEVIVDQKVRCPCGGSEKTEFMIQCSDPQCHVWQHIPCVGIPMKLTEGAPPTPSQHYCELCRIDRCDPFWKTLAHPLYPKKIGDSRMQDQGGFGFLNSQPLHMDRENVHMLKNAGYDVQAWCILLNDSVPFRMQWPQYSDLKVNGARVKTIDRPGRKMIGANGRDDGPSISAFLVEGSNTISLSGSDSRTFCFGVRLVKQRTFQEVISFIPREQEGEPFSEAVARVSRCAGRGVAAANADSSSDLDVIADNVTVNLRCPMSGCRMKTAARFKGCAHLVGFDLHTLVQINQRSRKWQCPICLKNYSLKDIIIDPYLNLIVKMMRTCDEDITEIEVKSDGSWRAKIEHPIMELGQWHVSDGSLCKLDSNVNCTPHNNYNLTSGIISRSSSSLRNESVIILSDSDEEDDETVSALGASIPSKSPNGNSSPLTNNRFSSLGNWRRVVGVIDWDEEDDTVSATRGSIPGQSPNGSSSSLAQRNPSSMGDHKVIVLSDSDKEDGDTVSAIGASIPSESPNGRPSARTTNTSSSLGDRRRAVGVIDWDEEDDTVSATRGSIPGQSPNGGSSSLTQKTSSSMGDHRVIVLSDSDEEDDYYFPPHEWHCINDFPEP